MLLEKPGEIDQPFWSKKFYPGVLVIELAILRFIQ